MPQLTVLTKCDPPAQRYYRPRYVNATVRQGTRTTVDAEGAVVVTGSTEFEVSSGSVRDDEIILWNGQHMRVEGLAPIPPLGRRVTVTAEATPGAFPQVPFLPFELVVDGRHLEVDGRRLVVTC